MGKTSRRLTSPPNASDGRPPTTAVESTDLLSRNTGEPRPGRGRLDQVAGLVDRGLAEDHDEQRADRADDHPHQSDQSVIEENSEAEQDDSEGGEGVEARERRGDERAQGQNEDESAEEDAAQPMRQQEAEPRPRGPLQPADPLEQPLGCSLRAELAPLPALRQPDGLSPRDQLQREEHGDQLEDVGDSACRQWKSG